MGAGQNFWLNRFGVDPTCGHVLSVSGSQAGVGLPVREPRSQKRGLDHGRQVPAHPASPVDLVRHGHRGIAGKTAAAREQGLLRDRAPRHDGRDQAARQRRHYFQRGVTDYPAIGDPAALITRDELRLIYDISGSDTIDIGHLQQDASIGAYINVDEMLSKHFAILGTTGVGKSSGVALILRQILEARPNLRHLPARRPQRIWPLLRRARPGAQSAQPQAAVLAVQFRGDGRRLLRRPARRRRRGRDPLRGHSARQERLHRYRRRRRSADAQAQAIRRAPASRSTRRCPIGWPTSSP